MADGSDRYCDRYGDRSPVMRSVPGAVATGSQRAPRSESGGRDPVATAPGTDLLPSLVERMIHPLTQVVLTTQAHLSPTRRLAETIASFQSSIGVFLTLR